MERKVFGITKMEAASYRFYIVWEAPAPEDETEPEYVKPLHVRVTLTGAQNLLHGEEARYRAEALQPHLELADTPQVRSTDDDEMGDAIALK